MYTWYVNSWIDIIQNAKKEITKNLPDEIKSPMDAFVDAQGTFARDAFKSINDLNAGWNKTITTTLDAMKVVADDKKSV